MKIYILILITLLLSACNGNTQVMKSKAKDTPEVRAMLEAFNKQEHRIEINKCELRYNGNTFFLGSTLEDLKKIFGEPDYNGHYAYAWKSIGVVVTKNKNNDNLRSIYLYIYEGYDNVIKPNDKYILIEGIPLNRNLVFADFINNSTYEFDDFLITKDSYDMIKNSCNNNKDKIKYSFDSSVPYDYSGGGHLQVRGGFRPDLTHPVERISIYKTRK